jgi:hypothetical protein
MLAMANGRGRPARTKIETLEIRARIVDLARQGHSQRAIAAEVGFQSANAVAQHLAAYRATLTPSTELAEEWRDTKLARADERFRRLRQKALGKQEDDGTWIVEPDYQALNALQREEESIAKLLGANLEPGVYAPVITREALAELLYELPEPVDVEAVEIHTGYERGLDQPR